jgi:hypothetical protein
MNSQLDEEYGAGFEGTKALLYKYIKDTPGQSIQQYMKTKSLSEILKKSDPVGDWIRDFIDSDNSRFAGKSKKERINMALGAYYAAQRNESIEEGSTKSYAYSTVIAKLKDGSWDTSYDVKQGKHLEVTDNATKKRLTIFVEAVITDTVEEQTKTDDKKMSYTAQVRQANKEDRAKRADAWRKVFSNLRKEEDEIELEESTVSASQINRYIDTENWKAIADLMKGLTDDEHELWAKNGYDGRTYELLMKSRERSKSYKDAVEKMKNTLGVKESTQIDEMRELYAVVDTTDGTVVATSSSEDGAKRSIRSAHLPPISSEHPSKLKIVKTKKTAQVGYPIKEETHELTEKIDVEALLDAAVALRKKNPQLRKGQSIMIALHGMDKKAYDIARNKADAFNNDSKIPQLIQLLDPSYYKEETNLKETPSLETLRLMKIVSLATGSKDADALYEYALTSPTYSSIVELKENFNKYIQDA